MAVGDDERSLDGFEKLEAEKPESETVLENLEKTLPELGKSKGTPSREAERVGRLEVT